MTSDGYITSTSSSSFPTIKQNYIKCYGSQRDIYTARLTLYSSLIYTRFNVIHANENIRRRTYSLWMLCCDVSLILCVIQRKVYTHMMTRGVPNASSLSLKQVKHSAICCQRKSSKILL